MLTKSKACHSLKSQIRHSSFKWETIKKKNTEVIWAMPQRKHFFFRMASLRLYYQNLSDRKESFYQVKLLMQVASLGKMTSEKYGDLVNFIQLIYSSLFNIVVKSNLFQPVISRRRQDDVTMHYAAIHTIRAFKNL